MWFHFLKHLIRFKELIGKPPIMWLAGWLWLSACPMHRKKKCDFLFIGISCQSHWLLPPWCSNCSMWTLPHSKCLYPGGLLGTNKMVWAWLAEEKEGRKEEQRKRRGDYETYFWVCRVTKSISHQAMGALGPRWSSLQSTSSAIKYMLSMCLSKGASQRLMNCITTSILCYKSQWFPLPRWRIQVFTSWEDSKSTQLTILTMKQRPKNSFSGPA